MRFAAVVLLFLAFPAAAWADEVWSQDVPVSPSRALQSTQPREPFDLVGLHWQGRGYVLFRTRATGRPWSPWRNALPEAEDMPDPRSAERAARRGWRLGNPYWVGRSTAIEYRRAGDVRRLRAWFVRASDADRPLRTLAFAGAPRIGPRSAWGADEKILRGAPLYAPKLRVAIVHHTAGANDYSPERSAAIVRSIQLYHVKGNGWKDIGYNFLVDHYGQVFEGRAGGIERNVIGAHAEGFNTGSVGVAVIGNYGARSISPAARAALVKLLAWRLDVAHVDPAVTSTVASLGNGKFKAGTPVPLRTVSGHRDTGYTSCPGDVLYRALPSLAAGVAGTGLPKLYDPVVRGGVGGPVTFSARLSSPATWRVSVFDAAGLVVATGAGTGQTVSWTWNAALAPKGGYRWAIEAGASTRPASGRIGRVPLTGGATPPPPPPIEALSVEPAVISPNGDGFADSATVSYTLRGKVPVTAVVRNVEANVVTTLFTDQVQGARRQSFPFAPGALGDGTYVLDVSARAGDGRVTRLEYDFVVDRTLASVSAAPAVFSPNGDGRDDSAVIAFTLAATADVTVQVEQAGQVVDLLYVGTLPAGEHRFGWDGVATAGPVADGAYDAVVLARTPLTTVRQTAAVTINRSA